MPGEIKSDLHFQIGHVLFIDIVGYSNLLINEQRDLVERLNQLVRSTDQFRAAESAGELIRLPAGDIRKQYVFHFSLLVAVNTNAPNERRKNGVALGLTPS